MLIYLFWSEADVSVSCFTLDPEGNNLPAEFAPWSKNGDGRPVYSDDGLAGGEVSNQIVEAVQRDGLYVLRSEHS